MPRSLHRDSLMDMGVRRTESNQLTGLGRSAHSAGNLSSCVPGGRIEKALGSLDAGVTGGCEPPDVDTRNHTLVLSS